VSPSSSTTPTIYNAAGYLDSHTGDRTPGFTGDGGQAGKARLNTPTGVATDIAGNTYIADTQNNRIRKVTSATTGIITTVAGSSSSGGYGGDGGPATSAKLYDPTGVAVDGAGDIFIADTLNNRIREVTPNGIIKTVAGTGSCPDKSGTGDGGPAASAKLCLPTSVAIDGTSIVVADTLSSEVRKFTVGGNITAIATYPKVLFPEGVAADTLGNVYVGDTFHNQVKEISSTGAITTFAGTGSQGYGGDGGSATAAKLNLPSGVAFGGGNVYISDTGNNRIRIVSSRLISTYGGTGIAGYTGDGGQATAAKINLADSICGDKDWSSAEKSMGGSYLCSYLNFPTGVAAGGQLGEVYLADTNNNHVRAITPGPAPVIAETTYIWLLPLSAVFLGGIGFVVLRRRRRLAGRWLRDTL